jgi:antitoxin ParD1/3/4
MTTVTMNISLTEDLKSFVDSRIKARGYSSGSEYMRDLVRRDEERLKEERFQTLIEQGLQSPLLPESFDLASHMQRRAAGKSNTARREASRA